MAKVIIRIYGIRPAQDGSGNIIATVEAFCDGQPLPGRAGDVVLTQEQFGEVWAQPTLEASLAFLVGMAGTLDSRFCAENIGVFLASNTAAEQAVAGARSFASFPLDLPLEVA